MTDSPVNVRLAATVAPSTVHRIHADTVFLSDVRPTGGDGYVATAVLPSGHAYYSAHTAPANQRLDPMLVLEACRQAGIYHAHAYYDVPADAVFLLLKADLTMFADAHRALPAQGPGELTMTLETSSPQWVQGRLRSFAPDYTLSVGGVEIGRMEFAASLATREHYAALRRRRRPDPLPSSDEFPDPDRRGAVAPSLVGRVHAHDVLLADLQAGTADVTARVIVPVRHLGLFDHQQDHVPGSLLVEAARQLGTALSARPAEATATELRSTFHAFAELDAPVHLRASTSDTGALTVVALQGDLPLATTQVSTHP